MKIDILTLFPEMVEEYLRHSIIRRAQERNLVSIRVVNIRDFTTDRHRTADDAPYGGGGGMVLKIEPVTRALHSLISEESDPPRVALTDPRGQLFNQSIARMWAKEPHIILICGHYEGVDERVRTHLATDVVSIGDYVLTGGELAALVVTDALTRLQPGALGDNEAPEKDSFAENLLEHPQYTRPALFNNWSVPEILLGGHHARIQRWKRLQSLEITRTLRPDIFERFLLTAEDRRILEEQSEEASPEPRNFQAEKEHNTECNS